RDITPWKETAQPDFLNDWAARNFGKEHAPGIAAILDEYYRLNFPARPEHLLKAGFTDHYGEREQRLARFAELMEKTDTLSRKIPKEKQDAYCQLVPYPVRGSALMNQKYLVVDGLKAHKQIQGETRHYNEKVAGGKWKH